MGEPIALFDEVAYVQVLGEFTPGPIHDDAGNDRSVAILEAIDAPSEPTQEQIAVAEVLTTFVMEYEKRYALEETSGRAVLAELMNVNDLKRKDLEGIASRGMLADVLNGRREISKALAKKPAERFNVSYSVFL